MLDQGIKSINLEKGDFNCGRALFCDVTPWNGLWEIVQNTAEVVIRNLGKMMAHTEWGRNTRLAQCTEEEESKGTHTHTRIHNLTRSPGHFYTSRVRLIEMVWGC